MAAGSAIQIPSRLPLLLTHESVLLPGSTMRTSVDSPRNMQLVRSRLLKGTSLRSTIIGVIPNTSDPTSDCDDLPNLHRCGPVRLSLPLSRPAGPPEPGPASPAGAPHGVTRGAVRLRRPRETPLPSENPGCTTRAVGEVSGTGWPAAGGEVRKETKVDEQNKTKERSSRAVAAVNHSIFHLIGNTDIGLVHIKQIVFLCGETNML